jgi:PAS domain S-box-containing protein
MNMPVDAKVHEEQGVGGHAAVQPPPRSISKDLTLGLILVVLIVSSIALLTAFYVSQKKAAAELKAKADEYVAFIKDTLVPPLWNYDFETINAVCQTYLQNDLITGIQVNDRRGRLNISMAKEDAPASFKRTVELSRLGIPIGQVAISMTHGYQSRFNRQLFGAFTLTILINLATLAVLTGLMLRMSLKRPLDQLNRVVDSYAAGEYRSFGNEVRHAEFQPLVNTLDQMGQEIRKQLLTTQKAEKKYRSIFENAIEGIYQSTPEGSIINANPAFARILGYDSPAHLMAEVTDIGAQHWVDVQERQRLLQHILTEEALTSFEARLVRRDGRVIWVLINGRPVRDETGKLLHMEGMVQDITHRKEAEVEKLRLETKLRQTQKMEAIGTLAGGIAHDFNNMLGVIIGCSELAMEHIPEKSVTRTDMEKVLDAGLRAKTLVRQILTFSRQSESELKPLLLSPFTKEVIKFLKATLPVSVDINLRMEGDGHVVLADPIQMQQVLMNLCTNAAQAMQPEGGSIEVSLRDIPFDPQKQADLGVSSPGSHIVLSVEDTGHGIAPENLHRIFDPFFTTKEIGSGTGLGLSVVHGIVKAHGGQVIVHSKEGQGTLVEVLLPSLVHPEIDTATEAVTTPPEGHERILLVEDEPVLADIIQRILKGLGYKVTFFTQSPLAVDHFNQHSRDFDLALLDNNMPEINGIQVGMQLHQKCPPLPVILYTGFQREGLRRQATQAGISKILSKPLNRLELAIAIRKVLDATQ